MEASHPAVLPSPGIREAIWGTLRANRWACLGLNVVVIALVSSYYRLPAAGAFWQAVALWKTHGSYAFSGAATILAAVIFPMVLQRLLGLVPGRGQLRQIGWMILFWGYRGMEIDLFYRIQGHLFGTGTDVSTVAIKLAVDQFVYSAFWAVPTYLCFVRWLDLGSWKAVWQSLDQRFWKQTYLSVLLTNWLVWFPAVSLVYSLPPPLQFPLFSIVLTFYILLVTMLVKT